MKYVALRIICKFFDVLFFQKRLPGIPVLLYHAIGDTDSKLFVSTRAFEQQMKFLAKRGYRSILPHELAGVGLNEKVFLITFDDGFKSVHESALPVLTRYGFRATVFVATDYIGKKSTYARSSNDKLFNLMHEEDIRALAESGWCIANHFAGHKNLAEVPIDEVLQEYHRACDALERMGMGASKQIVAYPFNRYNEEVIGALREAGVQMAFNGGNRLHTALENELAIPRIEIDNNVSRFKLIFLPVAHRLKTLLR